LTLARRFAWVLPALLLGACGTLPPADGTRELANGAYQERAAALTAWVRWDFIGQLSVDDGSDGGTGRLHWRVREQDSRLDFRGSLGRGAWRMTIQPGSAVLEKADGSRSEARSVEELIQREVGWRIPVESLRHWVLGLRAPGHSRAMEVDDQGRITRLEQQGWSIDFDRYRRWEGVELPGRIEAVRGELRVKLVAGRWSRPQAEAGGV
jgi:outer membrane lipoprotein LolB